MIVCISDYYQGPDISTTQISKYERIIDNLKVFWYILFVLCDELFINYNFLGYNEAFLI